MSFDVLRFIAVEFRGHRCSGIFSVTFLRCADGFQMKWMLQQTCRREKDDVWERIRAHGYTRAALRQVIFCWNGENKIERNENIY